MEAPTSMDEKWGHALEEGWTGVPNALLKNASKLGIDPTETLALIHLLRFWWTVNEMPYPSISKTSEEMGVTRKTLAKKMASLEEKGLIKLDTSGSRRRYSLDGLRKALLNLKLQPEIKPNADALRKTSDLADKQDALTNQWISLSKDPGATAALRKKLSALVDEQDATAALRKTLSDLADKQDALANQWTSLSKDPGATGKIEGGRR